MTEPIYLSMPDPCAHYTRLDALAAGIHGDWDLLDHIQNCEN